MSGATLNAQGQAVLDQYGNVLANIPPWVPDRYRLAAAMAAAPELCAALELCLVAMAETDLHHIQTSRGYAAMEAAAAALRKARGETP